MLKLKFASSASEGSRHCSRRGHSAPAELADARQALHGDAFGTKGVTVCYKVGNQNLFKICFFYKDLSEFISGEWQVRSITTLAAGGIVKQFTLRDTQGALEVTLHIPHGTQLLGTDKLFGVSPQRRYIHGVEANSSTLVLQMVMNVSPHCLTLQVNV